MANQFQDAMGLVRKFGKPDLFITMTCNPKWTEITAELRDGEHTEFLIGLQSFSPLG